MNAAAHVSPLQAKEGLADPSCHLTIGSLWLGEQGMEAVEAREELRDILAAAAGGDEVAFRQLYERTGGKLFSVVTRILKRADLAEEVLQEVYLQVWRRASDYQADRGTPMTWLITIARNAAIDRLRQLRRDPAAVSRNEPAEVPDVDVSGSGLMAEIERRDDARSIAACLQGLSEVQRKIILLAYYHGYSRDELAERLDLPVGTVKSHIRRGLISLKACLER